MTIDKNECPRHCTLIDCVVPELCPHDYPIDASVIIGAIGKKDDRSGTSPDYTVDL